VNLAELSCFTLLYRPEATGQDRVELLTGQMSTPEKLADIPLSGKKGHEALSCRFGRSPSAGSSASTITSRCS
jgi:hypothetical protein